MKTLRKWLPLILVSSTTLIGGQCAMNLRDAVIGGAMDFVTDTTSSWLGELLPLTPERLLPARSAAAE